MDLFSKPHLFQRFTRPVPSLRLADAGDGQRKFYICQDRLVRDQVIALEYEADRMVPVRIPVPVLIFLCRDPVDDQVPAVIAVQSSDDIQKRRLARAARTQDGDEFIIPEIQAYPVQRFLDQAACAVLFADILDPEHFCCLPSLFGYTAPLLMRLLL